MPLTLETVGNEVVSSMATLMSGSDHGYPEYAGGGDVPPEEAAGYRTCNYPSDDVQYAECYGEYRPADAGQWDTGYPVEQHLHQSSSLKQEDRMETSGDSAFSSMASGRVSSSSDVSPCLQSGIRVIECSDCRTGSTRHLRRHLIRTTSRTCTAGTAGEKQATSCTHSNTILTHAAQHLLTLASIPVPVIPPASPSSR